LDVQTEFFFREVKADLYCPAFRCRSLSRRREAAIASVIAETVERYLALEELFLHKDEGRRLPNLRSVKTLHDAELAAEELRNKWELGQDPVDNLTRRLEDRGVQVLTIEGIEGLDGYSCIANGVVPVIASCTGLPGDRQRFTLAHELAHLVLEICASVDEEKAAHRFAAAFLAPKRVMFSRLGSSRSSLTLYELGILKRELGMSMQAIVKRAFDLGIIQERTYHEIFGRFSSFGWRKEEPGPQLPVEKPERFGLLINQALAEGILTPSTARKLAGEPAREKPATGLSSVSEAVIDEYLKNEELIALAKATTGDMYDYEKSWDPSR
jgi:Zn-dependent peptidase ImmA (M78 family)